MSVTFAPRERIRVNASWPGVSTKTTLRSFTTTLYAPICCVIPPASPPATSASRIASSKLVFPWSTCPMTVTTGGRGFKLSLVSSFATSSTISSSSDTTLTTPLNVSASVVAVGTSSAWLMLANTPRSRSVFKRSFARTSSFSASSRMVMPSVIVTSRGGAWFRRRNDRRSRSPVACSWTLAGRVQLALTLLLPLVHDRSLSLSGLTRIERLAGLRLWRRFVRRQRGQHPGTSRRTRARASASRHRSASLLKRSIRGRTSRSTRATRTWRILSSPDRRAASGASADRDAVPRQSAARFPESFPEPVRDYPSATAETELQDALQPHRVPQLLVAQKKVGFQTEPLAVALLAAAHWALRSAVPQVTADESV